MNASLAREPLDLDRILVVKLADIGDAVIATSSVAALRSKFPHARIDVLTAGTGVAAFQLCDRVDQVISLNKYAFDQPIGLLNPVNGARLLRLITRLRLNHYDAIVLLHHLTTEFGALKFRWMCRAVGAPIRAGLDNGYGDFLTHRAIDYGFGVRSVHDYGLDVVSLLGADQRDARPVLTVPEFAQRSAGELLAGHHVKGEFVVIHPGVGGFSRARNWYPDRFAEVARSITSAFGLPIVLVGASDSTEAANEIERSADVRNLVGSTSLPELAAVISRAKLVIGADSGVVHIAAAVDTPVIAIFGPSNHEAWKPFGAQVISGNGPASFSGTTFVIRHDLPCAPCFYAGYALGRREGCTLRTCLDEVSSQIVVKIATQILGNIGAPK